MNRIDETKPIRLDLLRDAADAAIAGPDHLDLSWYGKIKDLKISCVAEMPKRLGCGSTLCLAGLLVFTNGDLAPNDGDMTILEAAEHVLNAWDTTLLRKADHLPSMGYLFGGSYPAIPDPIILCLRVDAFCRLAHASGEPVQDREGG